MSELCVGGVCDASFVLCVCVYGADLHAEEHIDRGELRVALEGGVAELDARDGTEE